MAVPGEDGDAEHEPLVVLDDVDYAALDAAPLGLGDAGRAYLTAQGITSPATLTSFRVGAVDDATYARFGLTGRRRPTGIGVVVPTFHPSAPASVLGIVRVTPAQNKHRFITPPLGIGGPITLTNAARVVLADNPLLAMRLHQAGATDVALVEDVAVLPSLTDWLAGREVILVSHRSSDLAAMRRALGARGASVPGVIASMSGSFSPEVRALLGITASDPEPTPPITAHLLRDLHAFARSRVEAGEAQEALVALGLDIPDLVTALRLGFLPADYRQALSRDAQRALVGHRCGSTVMIPTLDEAGVIVDAVIVRTTAQQHPILSFFPEPRGMVSPEIARGHAHLVVTDTLRWLARLFRQGYRNVLLVRGADEARRIASNLLAWGVERITVRARRADDLAGALQSVGLLVTIERTPVEDDAGAASIPILPPAPVAPAEAVPAPLLYIGTPPTERPAPPTSPVPTSSTLAAPAMPAIPANPSALVFVEEDRTNEVATFQAGPVSYIVELRDDGETRRRVVIRCGGQSCQDQFDLSNEHQRQRCAGNAARRIGVAAGTIAVHLAGLLPAVEAIEDAHDQGPVAHVSPEDRAIGIALLEAPDLLARLVADLTRLGWIGEECAKQVLYLTGISRLLPQPVWGVYQASAGAAPWHGLGCIAALTPPEARTVFHRITDAAIAQADRASLRHRLLIIDQAETLRPEAALALRVLHERGGVGWATASSGGASALGEARGPVAVLAAATGALDPRCRDAFMTVSVDESTEQTEAILSDQRRRLTLPDVASDSTPIVARHHAAQRILERLPVRVPFADRIIFPAKRLRHRDEQAWFLGLVAASALLHQRQRPFDNGAVIATEADFDHIVRCTVGMLGMDAEGISGPARQLLTALYEHKLASFTMADLGGVFGDWTRWAFRAALQDLQDFGHVESPDSGRGRLRSYRLVVRAGGPAQPSGIRLRRRDSVGADEAATAEAVRVGEVGGTGNSNFTRRLTGA